MKDDKTSPTKARSYISEVVAEDAATGARSIDHAAETTHLNSLPFKLLARRELLGASCAPDRLGGGTYGRVSTCTLPGNTKPLAIKIYRDRDDTSASVGKLLPDALREMMALTLAGPHRNLVKVISAGLFNDKLAIVFERADFGTPTLGAFVARHAGAHHPYLTREIFGDCCAGIAHLHRAGFIHADVKPSNILLSEPRRGIGDPTTPLGPALADPMRQCFYSRVCARLSDSAVARIGDLGSCLPIAPDAREAAKPSTTAPYRAPELFDTQPVPITTAIDAWSLGLVLFEMTYGATGYLNAAGPLAINAKLGRLLETDLPAATPSFEGKLGHRLSPKGPDRPISF